MQRRLRIRQSLDDIKPNERNKKHSIQLSQFAVLRHGFGLVFYYLYWIAVTFFRSHYFYDKTWNWELYIQYNLISPISITSDNHFKKIIQELSKLTWTQTLLLYLEPAPRYAACNLPNTYKCGWHIFVFSYFPSHVGILRRVNVDE